MVQENKIGDLIEQIHEEIRSSEEIKGVNTSTTTGEFQYYGVRTPFVRSIGKSYWKILKDHGWTEIDTILKISTRLLEQRIAELRTIAFQWSFRVKNSYRKDHFKIFESWLSEYVTSWGSCDDLCTHSLGYFILQFPSHIENLKEWARSQNLWMRRGAAVSLIYGLRREEFLEEAFEIARILLHDEEMYVQKGYGWMLKEVANTYQREVFEFVLQNKDTMPRTSLRYAIEKMPDEMRAEAMS